MIFTNIMNELNDYGGKTVMNALKNYGGKTYYFLSDGLHIMDYNLLAAFKICINASVLDFDDTIGFFCYSSVMSYDHESCFKGFVDITQ